MSAVKAYWESNCKGRSQSFKIGKYRGGKLTHDVISSLHVPRGLQIKVFEHPNATGKSLVFYKGKYNNLGDYGFFNIISALDVSKVDAKNFVTVYDKSGYKGAFQRFPVLAVDDDSIKGVAFNDRISSIKIPPDCSITLYKGVRGGGKNIKLERNYADLAKVGFDNVCSSLSIQKLARSYSLVGVIYDENTREEKSATTLATLRQSITNNSIKATIEAPISYSETVGWEITNHWDNSIMIGISVSTEISAGTPGLASAAMTTTFSTEFTHSWGHKEKSSGETTLEGGIGVTLPPKDPRKPNEKNSIMATTTIKRKNYTIRYTATLKDKATGKETTQSGWLDVKDGFEADVVVSDE